MIANKHQSTLSERLLRAYKQAIIQLFVLFLYSIIAVVVIVIGVMIAISAFGNGSSGLFLIGIVVGIAGYLLLVVAGFASFLYAATRGEGYRKQLGISEAYVETFKLILELSVALIVGLIAVIIAYLLSGFLSLLFNFIGIIIFSLFPLAALYYVIDYLKGL